MPEYKPSPKEIKELRQKTLAGFQDCQKALAEAGGDMAVAEEIIRKKGLQVAAKKAHREAAEGLITARLSEDRRTGVLVEVNCESDFVAKTPQFQTLTERLAVHVLVKGSDGMAEGDVYYEQELHPEGGKTVKTSIDEVIGQIGEHMCLKRTARFAATAPGLVHAYVHPPGKVGVLVELGFENEGDELAHELALQIAFADPSYVSIEDIPDGVLQKERLVAMDKARAQGKPEHIVPKIAEGMLRKFYSEECLLEQPFAKEPKTPVKDVIKQAGILGVTVRRFARFALK
jgi:elongation factor Ts